jgi:predicted nuclease of predicted toxin-antitoxin system
MKTKKFPFLKQKLFLYFDENFPKEIVESIIQDKYWKKIYRTTSALREGNLRKDDNFHYSYCKRKRFTLVTLDSDFMDDKKFPISNIFGIIRIDSPQSDINRIHYLLNKILSFLYSIPRPRGFVGDTKFEVSSRGCLVRGRDAVTKEIKSMQIHGSNTQFDLMKYFNWF